MVLALEPSLYAFVAGLASFLSPCVFPLVPVYAGYLGGRLAADAPAVAPGATLAAAGAGGGSVVVGGGAVAETGGRTAAVLAATRGRASALLSGLAFTAGFSAVFVVIFYVLAAFELPFQARYRTEINIVSGAIVIVLALQLLGVLRIPALMRERRAFHAQGGRGVLPAFLLGVSFAAGWTPCIGAQLGAILSVAANGSFSALPFMLVYCAGLAVPFLAVAVLADRIRGPLRALNRGIGAVNLVAGALLIVFGVLLITNRITFFNSIAASAPFGT